uniref:cardiolipin synthase n=1 Tax=Gemmiger formicilis TaxID=745368 RepID=UPI0040277CCF
MKDDDNHILLLEKGKRGLLQIIFGRTGIIIVSLIVQILFLFAAFYKLEGFLPYFWGGNTLLSAAVVLFLFGNDDNPTIKLTWFFILAVLPVFGLILYVYIKTDLGHRLMIRRYNDILSQTEHFAPSESACSKEELPEELQSLASYLNSCGFPCYQNTQAQYFPLGDDAFAVMCDELQKAEHFIFLEYFIVREGYMWGRILEILKEKVNAGVEVRVLYDGTCAVALLPYSYPEKLEKLGIACKMFAPLRPFVSTHYNYRDHRKIMVIDGQIAFTGGVNLADEYINKIVRFGYWKDSGVRLDGPGAASLANIFLTFWKAKYPDEDLDAGCDLPAAVPVETDCLVQPFADTPVDREAVAKNVYLELINQAQKRLYICTPYLILDNDLLSCLRLAAKRGVDVRIYTPGVPDKPTIYQLTRSYFPHLLRAGVKIYSYTPGFLHAKTWLVDDRIAAVGTVNLDYRSLYLHFENSVLLYGGAVLDDVRRDLAEIEKESAAVTLADCRTGFFGTLYSAVLRLVAPLC